MITDVDGLRIHVREGGRGPPVVCVHGCALSSLVFADVLARLGDRRGVAPDLPGFGRSDKPLDGVAFALLADLLRRWLDEAAPDRYVLVAHGIGAVPALAASAPDRLAAVVLVNARLDRPPGLGLGAIPGVALLVARALARGPGEDEHRRSLASRGTRRAVARLAGGEGWEPVARRAREVTRHRPPTLLVFGTPDPFAPPWARGRLQASMPWASAVVLRGAGPVPSRDAPEALLRCIVPFLDRLGYP